MDFESYKKAYFIDPPPTARYDFQRSIGITFYFEQFDSAVRYYTEVLGPPAYVEGKATRGWRLGNGWLTLLRGKADGPRNVEVTFVMASPAEAEKLQQAFIIAGGKGTPPTDELMYEPVRFCPVVDPFGTELLVISLLTHEAG